MASNSGLIDSTAEETKAQPPAQLPGASGKGRGGGGSRGVPAASDGNANAAVGALIEP